MSEPSIAHAVAAAAPAVRPVDDPWLTLTQASEHAQLHEATLRREIRAGRLRHARVGGRKAIRLRRSWVDAWLTASSEPVEVLR